MQIYELPSKYSDIYKKPFEIRCSSIHFGIVEFGVDTEVVLMKEAQFEMKLTGKNDSIRNKMIAFFSFI
jgi:hypothetical protein